MSVKISPAEWDVLKVVWDRAPVTAPQVYEALSGDKAWHPKTVNTFLTRLVGKGILKIRRDGRSNLYEPLLSREQCIREESATFLHRVFSGSLAPMVMHFVENSEITDAEIAELREILKKPRTRKPPAS